MRRKHPAQIVRDAECVVQRAYWRICAQAAMRELAGTRGVARTPLLPGSDAIQLVSYDGEQIGHIQREGIGWGTGWWTAVPVRQTGGCGRYHSAAHAAVMLARASGKA